MRARESQSSLTVSCRVRCFFCMYEAVLHVLLYNDQLEWLLNSNLSILRVHLHESRGNSRHFDSVKWSKMCLPSTENSCPSPVLQRPIKLSKIKLQFIHTKSAFAWEPRKVKACRLYQAEQNASSMLYMRQFCMLCFITTIQIDQFFNFNLLILRVRLHESIVMSKRFGCVRPSKMFLCTRNGCTCPI